MEDQWIHEQLAMVSNMVQLSQQYKHPQPNKKYISSVCILQFFLIYTTPEPFMNIQTHPQPVTNQPINKQEQQPQYQDQYEYEQDNDHIGNNDHKQDGDGLEIVIEQKVPMEQVISLAKQQHKQHDKYKNNNIEVIENEYRSPQDDIEQKTALIQKLKQILHLKTEQVKQLKKNITTCKKQIKQIGQEVDKEMNKSILRHSKPYANISIQSIFQSTKSEDPQVKELVGELERVRAEVKRVKGEAKGLEAQVMAPVNLINSERATEIRAKIKDADSQLKKLRQQKQYLEKELKMIDNQQGIHDPNNEQQLRNNRQKNTQLLTQLKQQKNKIYELEKEDRTLTQKIRFIEELDQGMEVRKPRATVASVVPKEEIQSGIKQIVEEIREIIEKRNKVQNEKKNAYKFLETDVANMEAKNWQIINRLRQIDAKLIKHYNSKLKKSKPKKQTPGQTTFFQQTQKPNKQKQKQKPLQNIGSTIRTVYRQRDRKNDKNYQISQPEPVIMVQKRKNYEFFMSLTQNQQLGNIILSDEMLGNKLSITRLSFFIDENILYGMTAQYENDQKNAVHGYKIMSRIKPKDIVTKTLLIDNTKSQVLNFIQIGIDTNQNIKYLQLVTSEAKEFKWGNLEQCKRTEQKNIRKYENIVFKGKLNQIGDREAPNYYCLAGIGFSVVYLAPK